MRAIPKTLLLTLPTLLAGTSNAQEAAGDEVWNLERMRTVASGIQVQIEALRGREFTDEVNIELADAAEFLDYARRMLEADGGKERLRREEEVSKLLGLIPGDMDLAALTAEVLAEQVGGFYDARTNTFYVMDSVHPDLARVVIAHEFTHALDDQHFNLDGTAHALKNNADAAMAYHAVVEGSGMELMFEWARHHMGPESRTRMMQAQAELPNEAVGQAPPVVWKPLVALYYQGQAFLRRQRRPTPLSNAARMSDIDRALEEPPRSTEQVLHPLKYWSKEHLDEPRQLVPEVGQLPDGCVVRHENTLGELHTAMITTPFAERRGLDVSVAGVLGLQFTNDAAAGWGGDRYVLLERGAGRVLVWGMVWDSLEDADEFAATLSDLVDPIEAAKALAPDHDPERSGLRIQRIGGDGVRVISWQGMTETEAEAASATIEFAEVQEE